MLWQGHSNVAEVSKSYNEIWLNTSIHPELPNFATRVATKFWELSGLLSQIMHNFPFPTRATVQTSHAGCWHRQTQACWALNFQNNHESLLQLKGSFILRATAKAFATRKEWAHIYPIHWQLHDLNDAQYLHWRKLWANQRTIYKALTKLFQYIVINPMSLA